MVCLDTDILIDFLRNDKIAIKKISKLKESNVELTTTTINTFELFKGALRSKQGDALENLVGLLINLKILDFDFSASRKAADIFEALRIKGETVDSSDLIIASIAIMNNEHLLTRNLQHFKRIPELNIEGM